MLYKYRLKLNPYVTLYIYIYVCISFTWHWTRNASWPKRPKMHTTWPPFKHMFLIWCKKYCYWLTFVYSIQLSIWSMSSYVESSSNRWFFPKYCVVIIGELLSIQVYKMPIKYVCSTDTDHVVFLNILLKIICPLKRMLPSLL